jgi:hypothetical protein
MTVFPLAAGTDATCLLSQEIAGHALAGVKLDVYGGVYPTTYTIVIPSGADIEFHGRVILQPSLTWDPATPVVKITGRGVRPRLRGMLEIDGRGASRDPAMALSQGLVITNVDDFDIEYVRFTDVGVSTADPHSLPSGPNLLLGAVDDDDDLLGYGPDVGGPLVAGPICKGRFGVAEFIKADDVAQAFAIRCLTNWCKKRDPADFINRVQHVRFEKVIVRGSFQWNATECAGGGTVDVGFGEIDVEGKTLTACDFDKGVQECFADLVVLRNSGKPDRLVGDVGTRFFAVNIHGLAPDYRTVACSVGRVVARDCASASTDTLEAFVSTENVDGATVGEIDAENLNDGQFGAMIVLGKNSRRVDIGAIRIRGDGVQNLVLSDFNGSGYEDITIRNIDASCIGDVLSLNAVSDGQTGLVLRDIRARTSTGDVCVLFGIAATFVDAVIDNVELSNDNDAAIGFELACARSTIRNSRTIGVGTGFHFIAGAHDVGGCEAIDAATPIRIEAEASCKQNGNSWN